MKNLAKMFYVVEEHYVKVSETESRLFDYEIKGAADNFNEAAMYVNDVFENHNRRGNWKRCAGGEDGSPVCSIVKRDENGSIRMYVKE